VKRLLRILRNTAALLSLLLLLTTVGSCVRSQLVSDEFSVSRFEYLYGGKYWTYHQVHIGKGAIAFRRGLHSIDEDAKPPFHRTEAAQHPETSVLGITLLRSEKKYLGIGVGRFGHRAPLFSKGPDREIYQVVVPFGWVAFLLLLIGSPFWFLWYRARRRSRIGLCPTCGYDLRATPDRCPECGNAVTAA
jgi:hypothetical protein